MSFILDALKKSEAERQRQAGPTLLELRITAPRRRYPLWALGVGALLLVNILVLTVVMLRRPPAPASAIQPSLASAVTPAATAPVPAASARAAAPAPVAVNPSVAATPVPAIAGPASADNAGPPQPSNSANQSSNPADYESAVAAPTLRAPAAVDYANLPNLSDLGENLPSLQLDLLDYSDRADERYALINMHRVREGDLLPEGARVLAITRDGVALDYHGQDFMLRPGGAPP